MRPLKLLLPLIICFFIYKGSYATTVIDSTKQDGNWSNATTWKNGRIPHDSDYVVINNYVYLDQNVTLSYPGGGAIYISPNGFLCGPNTLDCEIISYGPFSCNVFIWEGNSLNYSAVTIVDYSVNGGSGIEWISSPPGTICVGCPISCAISVPEALFIGPSSVCAGTNIAFTDESTGAPTNWLWLFPGGNPSSSTQQNPTVVYNIPGIYTITLIVSNVFGSDTAYKTININPIPIACCDTNIAFGTSTQLKGSGAVSYSWSPPTGLSCVYCPNPIASPLVTTTYTVTMTSDSGCVVVDEITVTILCGEVFVPDAFSPNMDGQNDVLYVRGKCIQALDFIVFDRWGNKLFESDDLNKGWDGTYVGQPMNTGTYVYTLIATMYNGSIVQKKGTVALVR